jgi:hypothetical protein
LLAPPNNLPSVVDAASHLELPTGILRDERVQVSQTISLVPYESPLMFGIRTKGTDNRSIRIQGAGVTIRDVDGIKLSLRIQEQARWRRSPKNDLSTIIAS